MTRSGASRRRLFGKLAQDRAAPQAADNVAEAMPETPAADAAAPPSPPARREDGDDDEDYSYRTVMSSFRL